MVQADWMTWDASVSRALVSTIFLDLGLFQCPFSPSKIFAVFGSSLFIVNSRVLDSADILGWVRGRFRWLQLCWELAVDNLPLEPWSTADLRGASILLFRVLNCMSVCFLPWGVSMLMFHRSHPWITATGYGKRI